MALAGGIDTLTHRRIVGWAWEGGSPDVPVSLIVAIGSRVLGRITADQFREDLATEGAGLGRVGFTLDLPTGLLKPREAYEIAVRVEGAGVHLPGSPYVLEPAVRIVR